MAAQAEFIATQVPLTVQGVELSIASLHRAGERAPILFLHGFGSTKEDYADIVRQAAFAGRPFVAYDAPGCGASHCADLGKSPSRSCSTPRCRSSSTSRSSGSTWSDIPWAA